MKKISYYIILIVLVGGALISFWTYQRYFKVEKPNLLSFAVKQGNIQESVRVRGNVIPQKSFDLEFPFPGTIESIFVHEGQQVKRGDPLMKLETTEFALEIKQIQVQIKEAQANLLTQQAQLAELKRGTRPEKIQIYKIKVENAQTVLGDSIKTLTNSLQDAYTKSDDAVRNKVDQFFSSPSSSSPQLNFTVNSTQIKSNAEWQRIVIEKLLVSWKTSLNQLTKTNNVDLRSYITTTRSNLNKVKSFLDTIALAVNSATPSSSVSQAAIDGWKANVAIARTNINRAIVNLTVAEGEFKNAQSNVLLADQELVLQKAGTTKEEISAQEARVKQAQANIQNYQAQIAIVQEKIKKSTLYAPGNFKIIKIPFEEQEFFRPGKTAIVLSTSGYKIQADISELDIGKIKENGGNKVLIQLDAFPNSELKGKIISIEPKEIIKDGDKYYRANIYIGPHTLQIRSGMNADLTILISSKQNVLTIPELVISKKNDKKFVTVLKEGKQKQIEIKTGISDGTSIEVVKGLNKGDVVVVAAD